MNHGWRPVALTDLADRVLSGVGSARPGVVAINGHSSSGKTSLAGRLQVALGRDGQVACGLLHSDDLAWHQGVFAWDRLLLDEVLPVVRAGRPLSYRPPAWRERGREGSVELPGGLDLLLVEGVGASQSSVRSQLDLVLWVETDEPTRLERDDVRRAAGEMSGDSYASWMAEENAYVTAEQPWRHADLVVYGGESVPFDLQTQVVIAEAG